MRRGLRVGLLAALALGGSGGAAGGTGLDARPANPSCVAPPRPSAGEFRVSLLRLFPTALLPQPVGMAQSPLDPAVWYISDLSGRIYRVRTDTPGQTTALDIKDRIHILGDMYGIALHPDFATNGQLFVYYAGQGTAGNPFRNKISRFTSFDGGLTFLKTSEQVVFNILQPTIQHNGGDIRFGPDGYLYIGFGDGGVSSKAQDLTSTFGKFLRIDVDGGVPYAIPPDNPFALGGGAPEIWAIGFRNPFRWSFDSLTGELWAGDVGQAAWEEIDVIEGGGNYGWAVREGAHCATGATCPTAGFIDPELEYSHAEGCAVMAGPVYRGTAFPALQGAVIFGDYCSGAIRAARPDGAGGYTIEELGIAPASILGFAQDVNGELLLMVGGGVFRIVPATGPEPPPFPQLLSETGCFDPSDPRVPAEGLIPYDVNEPLWSDGAEKERWLALPDGTQMHVNPDGDFVLPIGSVLVKTFSRGGQRIETRLFVRHQDGGWAGYTYEWNDAETEATLLAAPKDRTVQGQTWSYPSRAQCMSCHTFAAGYSLGLEQLQLNRWFTYRETGRTANQLETFAHLGLFDAPLAAPVRELPFLDRDTPNNAARGYLHANCGNCHRSQGSAWTPRLQANQTPSEMRVCAVQPAFGDLGVTGARVLWPGNPALSLLSIRPHLVGPGQMPPLARAIVDDYGTAVLDAWTTSWTSSCSGPDSDGDAIADESDNCPIVANPLQEDSDADGRGNVCETVCNDGVDNDGDGKTDFPADPGCASRTAGNERPRCNDGLDNDGDGRTDSPFDVACAGPWANGETSTCEDGVDNDVDGLVDFDGGASRNGGVPLGPPEPACAAAPHESSEAWPYSSLGCGLGPELLVALLGLWALRRRAYASSAITGA